MEINKQLFEDVLSGKSKGTFVLRSGEKICSSANLHRNYNKFKVTHPYALGAKSYTPKGLYCESATCVFDIVDFIPEYKTIDLETLEYCRKDFEFMQTLSKAINNMNTLEIEIPEGKEIDWKESEKQNKIVLKDKQITYKDICKKLFENKEFFFTNAIGTIESSSSPVSTDLINAVNNSTSYHQLECILAKNKLANVARYLNGEWKPIHGTSVWIIERNFHSEYYAEPIKVGSMVFDCYGLVIFKSSELAKQAIEILGEETIKLALEPLGI